MSVLINKYERNLKNRERCIEAHGPICSVCAFDFSETYGELGLGYIHVHHLTPLAAQKGKAQKVHPINDLRPVCPNCHEMLHRKEPPYTPEELQAIIAEVKEKASALRVPIF